MIGVLARWAVPGPDPMPIWMTIRLGVFGALLGNGIALRSFGTDSDSGTAFAAWFVLGAGRDAARRSLYRRYVQHRPITGPRGAERARRLTRSAVRRRRTSATSPSSCRSSPTCTDDGVLTDEEFEAKKAELLDAALGFSRAQRRIRDAPCIGYG